MPVLVKLTEEQKQFIRDNYLEVPIKQLAKALGVNPWTVKDRLKRWGLTIPKEILDQRQRSTRFKAGDQNLQRNPDRFSPEKLAKIKAARFQPGNMPANTKHDGHERLTSDGYVIVRVALGVYRRKHIVEWEKVNGKIPPGHVLRCLNGNKQDTRPENWRLIDRTENAVRTMSEYWGVPEELVPTKVLIAKLKNKIKNYEHT